jgi:hypothetical protein
MASARKSSNSKSPSARKRGDSPPTRRPVTAEIKNAQGSFAICVQNKDYPASLELRKLYRVLDDEFADKHEMIRIIDESGEDYLFPNSYFVRVTLPQSVESALRKIA